MLQFLVRRTAPPELDPDGPSRVERLAAEEWLAARIGIPWPPEPQAVHAGRPTFAAEYQAALQQFVRTHALEEELRSVPPVDAPRTRRPGQPLAVGDASHAEALSATAALQAVQQEEESNN